MARWLKPSDRTVRWALKIAKVSHMPWVLWALIATFFIDAFVVVIPIDGIMAAALIYAPDRKRTWYLAGLVGSFLGYLLFYFLLLSTFQNEVIQYLVGIDAEAYRSVIAHANDYGYWYVAWGLLTVVPPVICLGAGLVSGLQPFLVFLMLCVAKVFRLWLVIFLTEKLWKAFLVIKSKVKDHREENE